jgi:hypothetical protein
MDDSIAQSTTKQKVYQWITEHDNQKVFIIGYIGLALVLSTFISLFWLIFVVIIHSIFEYIKYKSMGNSLRVTFINMCWELKMDFALILFAFVIHLYIGFILGIAGLSGLAKTSTATTKIVADCAKTTQTATKFMVIKRSLRAGLLMLDEAVFAIRGFLFNRKRKLNRSCYRKPDQQLTREAAEKEILAQHNPLVEPNPLNNLKYRSLTSIDKIALILGLASLTLIILAPFITEHDTYKLVINEIIAELRPFP